MRPLSVISAPTAAVNTTMYTVPTGYYALIKLIYAHNAGGGTKHFTAQWYDASTATVFDILTQYPLNAKEYLQFNGNAYIVLEEGDQFRVLTETGSTYTIILTVEEIGLTRQ